MFIRQDAQEYFVKMVKNACIFLKNMLIFISICKCNDWVALCWSCVQRESGLVRAAYAQHRAFPQELPPEIPSRARRVIPLTISGVLAL